MHTHIVLDLHEESETETVVLLPSLTLEEVQPSWMKSPGSQKVEEVRDNV